MQLVSWKQDQFEVAVLGDFLAVDGWKCGNFGIYVCPLETTNKDWAYLVHLPSGDALGVFADPRIADYASKIVEALGDCAEPEHPHRDLIATAWHDAGLYVTGVHDTVGNLVWHWSASAARGNAGTA